MYKRILMLLAGLVMFAAVAQVATKVVTFKDGRKITGEVTRTAEGNYEIETKFGLLKYSADEVASVEDVITPQEEYNKKLAGIDPQSAKDHFELGRWAFEQGLLEIARKELQKALQIKEDFERAKLLLRQVEAKLEEASRPKPVADGGRPTTRPAKTDVANLKPEWLVGEEDIYRIRLEELREDDRVPVELKNDVLERFVDSMRGVGDFRERNFEKRFRSWNRLRRAKYIVNNVDRDNSAVKDDIIIKRDPKFMAEFRNNIWPIVAQNCATSSCHGGEKKFGNLQLFNVAGKNVSVDYTNYILLWGYSTKSNGAARRMIDRNYPDMSLLLQFGLPEDMAKYEHPV
ncbi:MAG: hypothetical protein KAU28_08690, partial [Phycisphaerae bacterium]|nr:hypothetical protein [Phycisphaerae bacterium]